MKEPAKRKIRLLVVEDHVLIRIGLRTACESEADFEIVAEAEDGEEALARFRKERPDIVILDLRLPGKDGIETLKALRNEFGAVSVLILSSYGKEEDINRAIQAGAAGYLLKEMPFHLMVEAIRTVVAGGQYFPKEIVNRLSERSQHSALTAREMLVLEMIAAGKTNKEIGVALGIVEGTVKIHVGNILEKMGVMDRTQAVTAAIKRGLLTMA